jgi:hypothetical protein
MGKHTSEAFLISAKDEFIFGIIDDQKGHRIYPSIAEVGERNSIAKSTLYRISRDENWQLEKDNIQQEMQSKRREQIAEQLIAEAEKLDKNSIAVAQGSIVAAGRVIAEATKHGIGYAANQISAVDFQRVVSSAVSAQRIGKLALGEAQFISKVTTDADIPEPLRAIIEQLDEVRKERSSKGTHTLQ